MAFLEIQNISKTYSSPQKSVHALDNVSFTMKEHEFCCLIGYSGCGKSTLLRIVDGLLYPTSGQVLIKGNTVNRPGFDRGMVFQQFNLLPWRTVLGNIEFGLETREMSKKDRQQRAMRYISMVGLDGFEDSYPSQLSGGMQQRVGLARALAIEPEILLMDEPASALDPIATQRIEELIYQLKERYTIVIVTHNMQQAARVSDLTAFFWLGRLIEYAPTDQIFTIPTEKLTEDYVTGRFG